MAPDLFITATDTGAGKTHVTCLLIRALLGMGVNAHALKPVASGLDARGHNGDIDALLAAQGLADADVINLYRFALPAAPAIAARAEGATIDPQRLLHWCEQRRSGFDVTLTEGVGGLMVPLAPGLLVSDWLTAMPECAVVLVVHARLGAINHALLTLDKLKRMRREPRWIILNDAERHGDAMLTALRRSLVDDGFDAGRIVELAFQEEGPSASIPAAITAIAQALVSAA